MANYATKFYAPSYTGGYTSSVVEGNISSPSNQPHGVIQVYIQSGTVDLQMRLTDDAPFVTIKQYTESTIEEVVLAPQMRVIASADAEVWLAETH